MAAGVLVTAAAPALAATAVHILYGSAGHADGNPELSCTYLGADVEIDLLL